MLVTVTATLTLARMPFPTKTVSSPSGEVTVHLMPHKDEAIVVVSSNSPTLRFSFDELPIPEEERWERVRYTTAGLTWYRNSIAFFDDSGRYFISCLSWGRHLVLDLEKAKITYGLTEALEEEALQKAKAEASVLLQSINHWDRQDGRNPCWSTSHGGCHTQIEGTA